MYAQAGLEVWEADYNPGGWQASWLLKILTPSSFEDKKQLAQQEQQLRKEFGILQSLSGCCGVPYCAPLIQDGEQLILPLKMPRGMPLSLYPLQDADTKLLLSILRRSVTALQQIHRRGTSVGSWHPNSIFISDEGDVEFIDINGNLEMEQDIQSYGQAFMPVAEVSDLPWVIHWFKDLAMGKLHCLDQLRSNLSALIAEGIPTASQTLPIELTPGFVINHGYKLKQCISKSETSELWQAEHIAGRYPCGISIYRSVSEYWPQLYSLYKSLEVIYHPNIERVIQFGQLSGNGEVFISRAWVEGQTLEQVPESLLHGQIKKWFIQLLTALNYLHGIEIFHGAICPQNIICNNNQAVLANFGIGLDIAASNYCKTWVDPILWSEEGQAEKDIFGLVASFISVLSKQEGVKQPPANQIITLEPRHQELLGKTLFERCQQTLTFDLMLNPEQSYLQLFGVD